MVKTRQNRGLQKPDLLATHVIQSLRDRFQGAYSRESIGLNMVILSDMMIPVKNRLLDEKLPKEDKNRLIELLDFLQDLYEAQSEKTKNSNQRNDDAALNLHQKFQSTLENKVHYT